MFQNVYLFNGTVENNIKFGCPDATHDQVAAAARRARCHDFIVAEAGLYRDPITLCREAAGWRLAGAAKLLR